MYWDILKQNAISIKKFLEGGRKKKPHNDKNSSKVEQMKGLFCKILAVDQKAQRCTNPLTTQGFHGV